MDYLKLYNSNYDKAFRIGESTIKYKLIRYDKESYSFAKAYNFIQQSVKFFEGRIFINKAQEFTELKNIYQNSLSNYSRNQIELVLKNEVQKGFSKISLNIQNNSYNFESFIKELAILNAAYELLRLFNNHYSLFKMMYENSFFDSFEIKDYTPIDYTNSQTYTDLVKRFYPERKLANKYSESILPLTNIDKVFYNSEDTIAIFNEKEKAFLLHSIYKILEESKTNMKLNNTEFYKVLSIVNLKDDSCLISENYKNSDYYRILSGGLEKISSDIKAQDNFIDILISKTKQLKLKNITKYLLEKSTFLKASIARNSNKAK